MTDDSFTTTLTLHGSPHAAFEAVSDPRRWWSAQIEGETDRLGGEFVFEVPGIHFTRFAITAYEPDRLIVWHAEEAKISFVADTEEWTGTDVRFEITPTDAGTEMRFTHEGLLPTVECYDACSTAWGSYLHGSLAKLIDAGVGDPNQERESGALAGLEEAAREDAAVKRAG